MFGQRSFPRGSFLKHVRKPSPQKREERQAEGNLHIRLTLLFRNDAHFGGLLATCHLLSPCHRPVLEASKDQTWIIHMGTLGFLGSAGLCQALRSVGGGGGGGDGRLCHKRAALSFSQRSLLKVTVTQGRFSQSQCLDTLCWCSARPRGF